MFYHQNSEARSLINKYRQARKGNISFVVVEGVHAFKHALRFGAEFTHIAMLKNGKAQEILKRFGTQDEVEYLKDNSEFVDIETYSSLSPNPHKTGIIALAKKPSNSCLRGGFMGDTAVFIENPQSLFNVGAVIRTVAATGVLNFAISGRHNPWHADCINTARGLHFALNCVDILEIDDIVALSKKHDFKICAFDTDTEHTITDMPKFKKKIFMFGTERDGLSRTLLSVADIVVKLPMRDKVSSLNLSASVAAALYADMLM